MSMIQHRKDVRNHKRRVQRLANKMLGDAMQLIIEKGWTKNALARDNKGNVVAVTHRDACKFCAMGALERARLDLGNKNHNNYDLPEAHNIAISRLGAVMAGPRNLNIPDRNDNRHTKKEDVVVAFQLAQFL